MATLTVAMSFRNIPHDTGKLKIVLEHYVWSKALHLDTTFYENELGQRYNITKFKYYIGKIHLKKSDGGKVTKVTYNDYYLIDEEDEGSKKIILDNLPEGSYTGIGFTIGIDSIDNCSGAQSGALDPVNGMFWTWNTGYIFLKLEGKAPASRSPGHVFEFHIGGYKEPVNCITKIDLDIKGQLYIKHDGQASEIHLKADVGELLSNPSMIDLSILSSITDFHHAKTVANNFVNMFSVIRD